MKLPKHITYTMHVITLYVLFVLQPLLDDFSNGVLFMQSVADSHTILQWFFILSLAVPACILAMFFVLSRISEKLSQWIYCLSMGFLLAACASMALQTIPAVKNLMLLTMLSILVGTGGVILITRFEIAKLFLSFMSPAILFFPCMFMFFSPVKDIVFTPPAKPIRFESQANTPIVMIVFDEFPLISLLDKNIKIDSTLYPNFSELAAHSTWFPNTMTVHGQTDVAIPAILTGKLPITRKNKCQLVIPHVSQYPNNLFTWLQKSYKLNIHERYIRLYNDETLLKDASSSLPAIMRYTFKVWLNYVYPRALRDFSINPLGKTVLGKEFAQKTQLSLLSHQEDLREYRVFLNELKNHQSPRTLYYIHVLLPHTPYEFYPSGTLYSLYYKKKSPCIPKPRNPNLKCYNAPSADKNYQKHLWQVEYVDKLLGEMTKTLKQNGLYDEATIIITADHGASLRPFSAMRSVTSKNYADIMLIPLIIKRPFQQQGFIDERPVQTIDIMPTIADILKTKLPWHTDGQSVFETRDNKRETFSYCETGRTQLDFSWENIQTQRNESLKYKLELLKHSPLVIPDGEK